MKTLIAALAATMLTASFAVSAANNLEVKVFNHANQATASVTQNGKPAQNYPVKILGINNTMNEVTSENGSVSVINRSHRLKTVTFIVGDRQGNTITKKSLISRDS
ncbi:MAG: hypothetical protein ACTMIA_04080 [Vibrio sp.]